MFLECWFLCFCNNLKISPQNVLICSGYRLNWVNSMWILSIPQSQVYWRISDTLRGNHNLWVAGPRMRHGKRKVLLFVLRFREGRIEKIYCKWWFESNDCLFFLFWWTFCFFLEFSFSLSFYFSVLWLQCVYISFIYNSHKHESMGNNFNGIFKTFHIKFSKVYLKDTSNNFPSDTHTFFVFR